MAPSEYLTGAELTPWTVSCPAEETVRHVRQTSCPGHFAVVTLHVEPRPALAPPAFLNAAPAGLQRWVPAVEAGLGQFVRDQAEQGKRLVGMRVLLTDLVDHPVDSRARSFEVAAYQVMSQLFETVGTARPAI